MAYLNLIADKKAEYTILPKTEYASKAWNNAFDTNGTIKKIITIVPRLILTMIGLVGDVIKYPISLSFGNMQSFLMNRSIVYNNSQRWPVKLQDMLKKNWIGIAAATTSVAAIGFAGYRYRTEIGTFAKNPWTTVKPYIPFLNKKPQTGPVGGQ
jgi:hypothetical protein